MKRKNLFLGVLAALSCATMTGCSVTGLENASSSFACGYDGDPLCKPLSNVHEDMHGNPGTEKQTVYITADGDPITRITRESPLMTPRRAPEMILRIWIAPFIDEDGDLHDQHILYSTVQRARWAPETLTVEKAEEHRVLRPLEKKPEARIAPQPSVIRKYLEGALQE